MHPTSTTVEPGRIIGSYRVVRLIGAGGMAEVHEAEHVRLGRPVALKILKPRYASRPEAVRSFFEEARLVSALNHPNIVQVTDLIVEPGLACCVMELLQGRTLAEELEQNGPLDVPDALRVAHAVADALAAAHEAGVVHRDIKPDNIFLAQDRPGHTRVKLLDFGVAHLMDQARGIGGASLSGQQAGTPAYMSPEQIQGLPVQPSSDIYSMGVVTYQMLTGKLPFVADSFAEYVFKHAHETPIPPSKAVEPPRTISRHCSDFVMRCLSKDPKQRLQDGSALREAIERTARATGIRIQKGTQPAMVQTSPRFGHLVWLLLILVGLAGAGLWATGHLFDLPSRNSPRQSQVSPPTKSRADEQDRKNPHRVPHEAPRPSILDGAGAPGPTPESKRPSPRKTATREVRIISSPPGAEVFLLAPMRRPLGITPLSLTMPAAESWTLEVKAPGRIPVTLTLDRHRPSPVHVSLAPLKQGQKTEQGRTRSSQGSKRKPRRHRRHRMRDSRGHPDSIGTVNPFHTPRR